jgi:hypothetical protein
MRFSILSTLHLLQVLVVAGHPAKKDSRAWLIIELPLGLLNHLKVLSLLDCLIFLEVGRPLLNVLKLFLLVLAVCVVCLVSQIRGVSATRSLLKPQIGAIHFIKLIQWILLIRLHIILSYVLNLYAIIVVLDVCSIVLRGWLLSICLLEVLFSGSFYIRSIHLSTIAFLFV